MAGPMAPAVCRSCLKEVGVAGPLLLGPFFFFIPKQHCESRFVCKISLGNIGSLFFGMIFNLQMD